MEDKGTELDNFSENKQARLPYHAPELVNLGQIQAIIRAGKRSRAGSRHRNHLRILTVQPGVVQSSRGRVRFQ